ncbi:MAG TPA: PAS domain S-box protein, partial [Methanoregulaceae archaeon]|nr:PAS domain S-box protein [Methanoregulaceae archaeon]
MISVLYVDDEPDLLHIGQLFLERSGEFRVGTVSSAQEALEIIRKERFDAIISDYQMPDMNGIDLLKQIRASGNTIPFIIFTGRGREEVVIEALNVGADFYLQKGGEPGSQFAELAHKVRQAVQQRRAEATIRDHERREADILNFLPDATFAIDTDGVVISWNKSIEKMTGVKSEDIVGKGNYEYAIPFYHERRPILIDLVIRDDPVTERKYSAIKRKGKNLFSEINIPHFNNGQGADVWFTASPLYDIQGNVIGAIESIREITERKKVEVALNESERRYRNVVEDQTEFISRFLPDGTHVFVNDAYCRYFGFAREEILGYRFRPEIPAEDQELVRRFFGSLTPDTPVDTIEHRIIMPDGSIRWQWWSDRAIFDPDGTIIEYQSVGRDITSTKEAEFALAESEAYYRSLAETSTDIIFMIDRDDRITYVNKFAAEMIGISPKEIIGRERSSLFPEEVSKRQRQAIEKVFETGEQFRSSGQITFGGEPYWFDHSLVPVRDAAGNITRVLGISRDIT